jgi:hypothetical protein
MTASERKQSDQSISHIITTPQHMFGNIREIVRMKRNINGDIRVHIRVQRTLVSCAIVLINITFQSVSM